MMRKIFFSMILYALCGPAAAAVFNYFGPVTGILKGSATSGLTTAANATDLANILTCATTQIVFDSSGALVCSSQFTWNDSSRTLTLSNSSATTDQKRTALQVDSSGNLNIAMETDAGVVSTTDLLQLTRGTRAKLAQLVFKDTQYGGTESFTIGGNAATYTGVPLSGVLFDFDDPGASGAFAGLALQTGSTDSFVFCTEGVGLGATLNNGVIGSHCDLAAGGNSALGFSSPVALEFGVQANFTGEIDLNNNTIFGQGTANAAGDTTGYFYVTAVAAVPTGVPASTTGAYAFGKAMRYDSTHNRLYVYSSGWKNVADQPTAPVLTGTTGSIGGSALAAGACAAGTASISGATSSMVATSSPSSDPDSTLSTGVAIYAFVSAANTVTVRVCAIVAVTPAATTYNVRVLQ